MSDQIKTTLILAIHAHPDDLEFQCAGTLALLKEKGCRITMATMTAGDCGSAELGREEISRIRRGEARASAELLGADYECLEFGDLAIIVDDSSRRRVTEVLRRVHPDIVITAPLVDYMCDHEATSRLVRDACFTAAVPNYATGAADPAPAMEHIPHLYFVDALEGLDYFGRPIDPEFIIDVTATFDLKRSMLACHESQRSWLRRQHGIDEYVDRGERWCAARGGRVGARYGEGFTQYRGHPYPQDNLLLKLVGSP